MSLWDSRQFAMQLVASGQPINLAIANVVSFERQWRSVQAMLSAEDHAYSKRFEDLRKTADVGWARADRVKWMRETLRLVRLAGEEAMQDAQDAEAR